MGQVIMYIGDLNDKLLIYYPKLYSFFIINLNIYQIYIFKINQYFKNYLFIIICKFFTNKYMFYLISTKNLNLFYKKTLFL